MPKQFDQAFKLLTEDDPRGALALFAGIPLTADVTVEPLDRELNQSTLHTDNLCRCRSGQSEFLVHMEAVSHFRKAALDRQFDYVQAIAAKYKLPCLSYLILLTEKGVPEVLPRVLRRKYGDFEATLRLRAVRLWRIPAERILQMGKVKLLPWTALLNASDSDLLEAAERLERAEQEELSALLLLFGGLRYGSRERFARRLKDMRLITEEILQESSTYQYIASRGAAKIVIRLLTSRFGPVPASALKKIDAASMKRLERWSEQVLDAPTLKDALK